MNKETEQNNPAISVAILGLGNPVVSDDAVGLCVAAEVERLLKESPLAGAKVLTSTRGGFELIYLLTGFTHALIIDCLDVPKPCPGQVRCLDLSRLSGSARLIGGHDLSLTDALEFAATLDVPMPLNVEIYVVEGGDTRTVSEEMTPAVAAAVAPLAQRIYDRACELTARALGV